tara:strand:+ start:6827 stop:7063 length:237 start_codon:yes stop_codon:yes gene_type:complete
MWQFWRWNGKYIQGDLISTHQTKELAIDRANKDFNGGIDFTEEVKKRKKRIWIDDENTKNPVGIIVETRSGGAKVSTG